MVWNRESERMKQAQVNGYGVQHKMSLQYSLADGSSRRAFFETYAPVKKNIHYEAKDKAEAFKDVNLQIRELIACFREAFCLIDGVVKVNLVLEDV